MALPSSNLWQNWRSDSLLNLSGTDVLSWTSVFASPGPTAELISESGKEAEFNGYDPGINGPVVFGQSSKSAWMRTAAGVTVPDSTAEITVYLICKTFAAVNVFDRYIDGGTADSLIISGTTTSVRAYHKGQTVQVNGVNFTNYHLVKFASNASGATLTVDGGASSVTSTAQSAGLSSGRLSVFSSYLGANSGDKSIAEIAIYVGPQTLSEGQAAENYFFTTYGLQAPAYIAFPGFTQKTTADVDFDPGATSNSSAQITYTSSNPAVATIVNGLIHIVGEGTTNITASQGAATGYSAAADVTRTLTVVTQADITFPLLPAKTVGDADFVPGVSSNNTAAPVSLISSNTAVATIAVDGKIHIVAAGQATITAFQAATAGYSVPANVSRILVVSPAIAQPTSIVPPAGMVYIDGYDLYKTFGMGIEKGSADLLRYAPRKASLEHDWLDQNGVDVDLSANYLAQREITLNCWILAPDENAFWDQHDKLISQLMKPGKHRLELTAHQGRNYYVYYKDCSNYTQVKAVIGRDGERMIAHKFYLTIVEPEPQLNNVAIAISDDNGRVLIT